MSQTGLTAFDSTIQTTNIWLNDVLERLDWQDRSRAYHALRAVLHALREQLSVEQVAALAAQLPMLVRGFYFEGWKPHEKPFRDRNRAVFLAHVAAAFREVHDVEPAEVARAVLEVVSKHVGTGEIEAVKRSLPADIRSLWP